MPPLVAITALGLALKGVKWLFDELTDEERKKQKEATNSYHRARAEIEAEEELIRKKAEEIILEEHLNCEEELTKLKKDFDGFRFSKMKSINESQIKLIDERISEKQKLFEDVKNVTKNIQSILNNSTLSNLRRNTLERFKRDIDEGKWKIKAYIWYLQNYKWYIEKHLFDDVAPFSFLLPNDSLYTGKIVYLKKNQISASVKSINIDNIYKEKYYVEDAINLDDLDDDMTYPVLCAGFDIENKSHILSMSKGKLKYFFLNYPQIGVTGIVKKYDRKAIILSYEDIELRLPCSKLENPNRLPPLKAELRIYPFKWNFALGGNILVSEYVGDGYRHTTFSEIPIVFTERQWEDVFVKYLIENNLIEHEGDWKIAPYDENNITESSLVKLQLDAELVFSARVVTTEENHIYFSFVEMLDRDQMLKPDDVFLGVDCTLATVLEEDLNIVSDEYYSNMADLVYCAFSEFRLQKQSKLSMAGMQYFNKWAEATDKLITYLSKGEFIDIKIDPDNIQLDNFNKNIVLSVINIKELNEFIDNICNKKDLLGKEKWFIEIGPNLQCYVTINAGATKISIAGDFDRIDAVRKYLIGRTEVRLYNKEFSYAEIQQAAALFSFRIGKVVKPKLQAYALDGKNVESDEEDIGNIEFVNKDIQNDSSQKEAVIRALRQKHFFMIQGPPGTGKTTVIREIITQTLNRNPKTRILVVSQANVAVDNVLKGLIKENINFIRCGAKAKMDDIIEPFSLERKYEEYVSNINQKFVDNPNNSLIKKWHKLVNREKNYNSTVSELLIKEADIIGATCVGLAQKRIGLGQVTFDLAIIDEAGKALPAEILIPFIRAKKVIMIGDHKQLPPTINSALCDASKVDFDDRSLFEESLFGDSLFSRIFNAAPDSNKCMLSTQYRMPAVIGSLISDNFYDGELRNGLNTFNKDSNLYEKLTGLEKNIIFIDTRIPENENFNSSVTNEHEAKKLIDILKIIVPCLTVPDCKIAIITPYKGQIRLIRSLLANNSKLLSSNIVVNTVDAFQGDEAEIVFFCTTRRKKCTDFFTDYRRINVAFSRTKRQLFILGSLNYFSKYANFKGGYSPLPAIAAYIKSNDNVKLINS